MTPIDTAVLIAAVILYYFAWANNPKRAGMVYRPCKVLPPGGMNSVLIEGLLCHRCNILIAGLENETFRRRAMEYLGINAR